MIPFSPPLSERDLMLHARALDGMTVRELARLLGRPLPTDAVHGKGLAGELAELALGASAGSTDRPDFIELGVELKTIPVDASGHVRESTYVCALDLGTVEREEWEGSRVRRKLARVLWLPVAWSPGEPPGERRYGTARLWSPSSEEEEALRADWLQLVGRIAVGGIDEVTAHMGQVLQIRPKAASGAARTGARGPEGELLETIPRGFYLRSTFTERVLWSSLAASEAR